MGSDVGTVKANLSLSFSCKAQVANPWSSAISIYGGFSQLNYYNPENFSQFIYMVYYIDRLSYVEPSLHLWDKAYLVMVDNVFDVFLDLDKDLSILLILSKIQLFVSLILCIVFFVSILLISALNLIIFLHLFLLGDFASSSSRAFSFHLVDLSIGWNLPSSAFCKAGFVDRLDLFMVPQISWTFCFMTFLDLVFSLTDESISSIVTMLKTLSICFTLYVDVVIFFVANYHLHYQGQSHEGSFVVSSVSLSPLSPG
ncbi:hypothetical protein STEG23_006728 [Scotinomys teguina]